MKESRRLSKACTAATFVVILAVASVLREGKWLSSILEIDVERQVGKNVNVIALNFTLPSDSNSLPVTASVLHNGTEDTIVAKRSRNDWPSLSPTVSATSVNLRSQMSDTTAMFILDSTVNQPDEIVQMQARLRARVMSKEHPVKAYVFPFYKEQNIHSEGKHFILDGILRSPYLEYTTDASERDIDVWIAQLRTGYFQKNYCRALENAYAAAMRTRTDNPPPIIILDWADRTDLWTCYGLKNYSTTVMYAKRSPVRGRRFNDTTAWVNQGSIHPFSDWKDYASGPVRNLPYAVRSDQIEVMEQILGKDAPGNSTASARGILDFEIVRRPRSCDVAHFWPSPPGGKPQVRGGKAQGVDRGGRRWNNSILRDKVSLHLDMMARKYNYSVITNLVGAADRKGRESASEGYFRSLLDCKIVVVAQKDNWEGHYRLTEALASGAMVVSDQMLTIPRDFRKGENIEFYDSLNQLEQIVVTHLRSDYEEKRLSIAQGGFYLSLSRHRSWHRMEEAVFGRILTDPEGASLESQM